MRLVFVFLCLILPVLTWSESFFDLVKEGDAATVQGALDAGADPEARDLRSRTPLMFAAGFNQNVDVVQTLLDAGSDPNARTEYGSTPLMLAASLNENPAVIQAY